MSAPPMSYSIWLKPQPDSAFGRQLAKLVDSHAAALGTPAFAPHVTLLGGFTAASDDAALATTRVLAERCARLQPRPLCRAARVEAGRLYYQCVYVRMEDDDALSAAHTLARDAFASAGSAGPTFMPHASVIYGDLLDEEKAERAQQVADELAPLLASGEAAFEPAALALWRTQAGRTTEWSEVAVVPLR